MPWPWPVLSYICPVVAIYLLSVGHISAQSYIICPFVLAASRFIIHRTLLPYLPGVVMDTVLDQNLNCIVVH